MATTLSPPTLSLCMIVKNEEAFLEGCLESVRGVVDEIVLVDTGSTDRTIEIANRFGARIVPFTWIQDFSAARNASLSYATGDWVLVLDADERLAPGQGGDLKRLLEDPTVAGYSLLIENRVGTEQDYSCQLSPAFRLFRNRPDIRYQGMIHEEATASAKATGLALRPSALRIVHLGYLTAWKTGRNKQQRNLPILERQATLEPNNPFAAFNLAEALKLLERLDEAESHYLRALQLLKSVGASPSIPYYANLYFSLADLHRQRRAFGAAHALLDEALVLYPTFPDLSYVKGLAYVDEGRHAAAIAQFERCLALAGVEHGFPTDPSVTGEKAHESIAACCLEVGDRPRARAHLELAVTVSAHPSANLHTNLGILLLEAGATQAAEGQFVAALAVDPAEVRAGLNLGALRYEQGRYSEAIAVWEQALATDPELPDVRALQAEAYLRLGNVTTAIACLRSELARQPDSPGAWLNMGLAHWLGNDLKAAREAWERAGSNPSAMALAILAAVASGADLPASRPADEVLIRAWRAAADLALTTQRTDALQTLLDRLPELGERIRGLEFGLGQVFLNRGLPELALTCFLLAQPRHPQDPAVYLALGDACLAAGHHGEAGPMYQKALELDPSAAHARTQLDRLAGLAEA